MAEQVDTQIVGHVGLLTFSNPPHNHVNVPLLRMLADALEQFDAEPEIRAVVLASEGRVFCAGADLVSADGFGASGDDPLAEFYEQAVRLFITRKPIVAAIQGAAIGAGLGLAVAADFRVASAGARFAANFVKLAFHPGFGLTCTLPRVIGQQRAAQMFLTADRYKPEEIADWGLIDRMADGDSPHEAALAFAAQIAENAPLALLATRATLRDDLLGQVRIALSREHSEQLKLRDTEDFAEGIRAVTERRPGNFSSR